MIKNIAIPVFILITVSCSVSRDIEVAKLTNPQAISTQSIIYALPQSSVAVTISVARTSVVKGIYADYAIKYLSMANVPMANSETYSISNINIESKSEADPSQYYSIKYNTYPDNLNKLLSVSNKGILLDFANAWKSNINLSLPEPNKNESFSDPYLLKETSFEKVDTFYKTMMKDSAIVRLPVIKKQTQVKNTDDFAKEAAVNLIKTRKRKLKILRGEYDFHPDGEALKVMITLLSKQEEYFYALFAGVKRIEKLNYTYSFVPQPEKISKDLCYFSLEKGIQDNSAMGGSVVSVQLSREQEPVRVVVPDKAKNILFIRIPMQATVSVKLKNENIATARLPIYQFGVIQVLPLQ